MFNELIFAQRIQIAREEEVENFYISAKTLICLTQPRQELCTGGWEFKLLLLSILSDNQQQQRYITAPKSIALQLIGPKTDNFVVQTTAHLHIHHSTLCCVSGWIDWSVLDGWITPPPPLLLFLPSWESVFIGARSYLSCTSGEETQPHRFSTDSSITVHINYGNCLPLPTPSFLVSTYYLRTTD